MAERDDFPSFVYDLDRTCPIDTIGGIREGLLGYPVVAFQPTVL